jgi:cytochrome c oxidase, subunit II
MNRMTQLSTKISAGVLSATLSAVALANDMTTRYNLRVPATELADNIYSLHNFVLLVCVLICVAVFGVMFYSIYAHRKSKGHKPAHFHESTSLEIAWTIVPFLIVVVIGVYATPIVMAQKDTTNADITVKATGYQWKWGYDYLKGEGQGIAFYSTLATPYEQRINQQEKTLDYLSEVDNPLVVPVGKKIRVVTTANDVIHAWMVPAFGVKQDAIPGFVRDTWFKADRIGTYNGHCAELCGSQHAFMPIVVKVVSAEDFTVWVNEQKLKSAALPGSALATVQ